VSAGGAAELARDLHTLQALQAHANARHSVVRRGPLTVSCTFTIDNVVDAVYYNGADVTSTVTPLNQLGEWTAPKFVTFEETGDAGGILEFIGHNEPSQANADGCLTAGLLWYCTGGVIWNGCVNLSQRQPR